MKLAPFAGLASRILAGRGGILFSAGISACSASAILKVDPEVGRRPLRWMQVKPGEKSVDVQAEPIVQNAINRNPPVMPGTRAIAGRASTASVYPAAA